MSSDPATSAKYLLEKPVTTCMHSDILKMDKSTLTREAADRLHDHERDEIVVMDGKRGVGMVTDKDILDKVSDVTVYAEATLLSDIMSTPLVTINKGANLREALDMMKETKHHKLTVVDNRGEIIGMIYKNDVLKRAEWATKLSPRELSPPTKAILGNLGFVLQFAGILLLLPALVATFMGDTITATGIYLNMVLLLVTGFFLNSYGEKAKMNLRQASVLVIASLFLLSLFGTIPYLYVPPGLEPNEAASGVTAVPFAAMREGRDTGIDMFANAFFSSAAGFTTGGISLYDTPEDLPQSFTFYRSFTQLVGGMSFIYLVMTAFYPDRKLEGMRGFITGKQLHLRELFGTIAIIFTVYIVIVAGLLYLLGTGNIIDDFSLAMSTLATGGFVPDSGMVANLNWQEHIVLMGAMILGALPFTFHHTFVSKKFRNLKLGMEVLTYLALLAAAILLFTLVSGVVGLESVFYPISASTTAGLQPTSLEDLNIPGQYILVVLMFVGGCGFSTAGGIKMFRFFHLADAVRLIFKKTRPQVSAESRKDIRVSLIIMGAFPVITLLCGAYLMEFEGADADAAFFDAAGVITTGGLSAGVIDFDTSPHTKILLSALMIFGRLEIIALVYVLVPRVAR